MNIAAFLRRPRIKKRACFGVSQKEPNGGKPNRNHHCEEENDAAFGPVHRFLSQFLMIPPIGPWSTSKKSLSRGYCAWLKLWKRGLPIEYTGRGFGFARDHHCVRRNLGRRLCLVEIRYFFLGAKKSKALLGVSSMESPSEGRPSAIIPDWTEARRAAAAWHCGSFLLPDGKGSNFDRA